MSDRDTYIKRYENACEEMREIPRSMNHGEYWGDAVIARASPFCLVRYPQRSPRAELLTLLEKMSDEQLHTSLVLAWERRAPSKTWWKFSLGMRKFTRQKSAK